MHKSLALKSYQLKSDKINMIYKIFPCQQKFQNGIFFFVQTMFYEIRNMKHLFYAVLLRSVMIQKKNTNLKYISNTFLNQFRSYDFFSWYIINQLKT